MPTPVHRDFSTLERLHGLIGEALALSDAHQLHVTGIALDTARLSVEDALMELRSDGCRERGSGGRRPSVQSDPEWRNPA